MTNDIIGQTTTKTKSVKLGSCRKMPDTIENHEERITNLEDTMRVNAVQETKLTEEVNKKIIGFWKVRKAVCLS